MTSEFMHIAHAYMSRSSIHFMRGRVSTADKKIDITYQCGYGAHLVNKLNQGNNISTVNSILIVII